MDRDLIVIGGGPGGYTAAIKAAQLGGKVCLIEKDKLGGTCLNRGCIPTKTLHRTAELMHNFKSAAEFGIKVDSFELDGVALHKRCETVSSQLRGGIEQLVNAYGIEVIKGTAEFVDKNTVKVKLFDGTEAYFKGKNVIIATGSVPLVPPIPGLDLSGIMTSDDLLLSDEIPNSMVIIGGGVIGIEFASIYSAFGCKVTIIEMLPTILSTLDVDITKRYVSILKRKGIDVMTSTKVNSVEKDKNDFLVNAEGPKGPLRVRSEKVLVAIGRKAEIEGLNLEAAGVVYEKIGIKTNSRCRTNIENIYSIGDVNGGIMLAHWASHQGLEAAEQAMGICPKMENISPVPGCIFAFPEIATVGLTEEEASKKDGGCKISKFMFGANGKALAMGETEGFVKVVADANGKILGVHIMGPHASDIVQEGVVAIATEMKASELRNIIHAHPTLGEALYEAFSGIDGLAIHKTPPKKI